MAKSSTNSLCFQHTRRTRRARGCSTGNPLRGLSVAVWWRDPNTPGPDSTFQTYTSGNLRMEFAILPVFASIKPVGK